MIANLTYGIAGLQNAQRGLQVVGQNLTNTNTEGYSRQRLENVETGYTYVCTNGSYRYYKGSGVDVSRLRQIRDIWLDAQYRNEVSKLSYYETEYEVLNEVENIFLNSTSGTFSDTLDSLYGSISTLSQFPYSADSRASFIEASQNFLIEAQYISKQLTEVQKNLNNRIVTEGNKANALIEDIYNLNEKICKLELCGDEANDLRDQRALKLDELAEIIPISVTEGGNGKVTVFSQCRYIVSDTTYDQMTFKNVDGIDGYVTPIWKAGAQEVINMSRPFDAEATYEDGGTLKALIFARGDVNANYTTSDEDINNAMIPSIKRDFDKLVNGIVEMINEALAPKSKTNGPYGLDESQYIELFSRKNFNRYDENGNYVEEDILNSESLYSIENLMINTEILNNSDKLCLSISGEESDNRLIEQMLSKWKEANIIIPETGEKASFENYLVNFMSGLATESGKSLSNFENQELLINQIDNQRQSIMGASLDEDLSALIKYQHSYSAASKVVKTIDSMIETLIMSLAV